MTTLCTPTLPQQVASQAQLQSRYSRYERTGYRYADKVRHRGRRITRLYTARRLLDVRHKSDIPSWCGAARTSVLAVRARACSQSCKGERRDKVNDENRDVRAIGDERRFYNSTTMYVYTSAFYQPSRARSDARSTPFGLLFNCHGKRVSYARRARRQESLLS